MVETNFGAWKQENVFALGQKHFFFPDTNFASATYVSHLATPENITRNNVSATMFSSFPENHRSVQVLSQTIIYVKIPYTRASFSHKKRID